MKREEAAIERGGSRAMSKKLSVRESAVLRVIESAGRRGADGEDLVLGVRARLGAISPADITQASVHQTAAALVRKNLAQRMDTRPQVYRITDWGRRALNGDRAEEWVAR